jgi:phosphomannomutase
MDSAVSRLQCFKAYDIRGRVPGQFHPDLARRIARAYAAHLGPRTVAVGYDVRPSSPAMAQAIHEGLRESGVDVLDVGLGGTEMVYFATFHLGLDGGIMVTASHNPSDYNGLKLVREGGRPISSDSGLLAIEELTRAGTFAPVARRGTLRQVDIRADYVDHLLTYVDGAALAPLDVVCNAGNGAAGLVIDRLEPHLPFRFRKVHHDPDGTFPNGVPNPILPQNRRATSEAVLQARAGVGIAWDGDYDRCFFFDGRGRFIEGCFVVGMLAERALAHDPGGTIIHDPRVIWNTIDVVTAAGGRPVQSKGGHAFMKEAMRREDAVYGGENPGHHFFREFSYCDSGMVPWLIVLEHLCRTGLRLEELVDRRAALFPVSGEINFTVESPSGAIQRALDRYGPEAAAIDRMDGISLEFPLWRFNLRGSNTEPLLRLNVEARGDAALVAAKVQELTELLG